MLSIGSAGSALSIGSIGSFASAFSIGSAFSLMSILAGWCCGSVMSYRSACAVLGSRQRGRCASRVRPGGA